MKKGRGLGFVLLCAISFSAVSYAQDANKYYDINQRGLSESAFKTGYHYFNSMDYEASINFFRQSIRLFPSNNKASYWLGRSLLLAGYKDQAIDQWENLIKYSGHDIFLEQELDKLYSENLRISKTIESNANYVFLRNLDTRANPVSIQFDQDNRLYVADYYGNKVDVYNTNLHKVASISTGVHGPTNVALSKNFIFISSFKTDTVGIYDIKTRRRIFEIGGFGFAPSKLAGPMGVFEFEGKIAVVDQSNNRIQIFQISPKPYFVAEFGKKGQGAGQFHSPTDIILLENKFWVVDKGNQRIQIFDRNGNYIRQIKDKEIQFPNRLFFYKNSLFLVDEIKGLFLYNKEEAQFFPLKKPSDGIQRISSAAIDNNGILFFSEFTNPSLTSFALDVYKLNSLNLRTFLVSNEASPRIVMKIRVQDTVGQDIKGLVSKNFLVEQDGFRMGDVQVTPIRPEENKIALTIMIRNNKDMALYKEDIYSYVEKTLDKMHILDRVRLVTYGGDSRVVYDFSGSKISILESLRAIKIDNTSSDDTFDTTLYNTISQNRFNDMHNAIIVIDNANRNVEFPKYSLGTIANYAKNMGVSLHIVNFGSPNSERKGLEYFEHLAKESQGIVENYYTSNSIFDTMDKIRNQSALFYTLSYNAPVYRTKGIDIWSQVVVRLNYRSLNGVDKTGYFLK